MYVSTNLLIVGELRLPIQLKVILSEKHSKIMESTAVDTVAIMSVYDRRHVFATATTPF